MHHAVVEALDLRGLRGIVGVEHEAEVEIAVADVADDGANHRGLREVLAGLGDAFGEPRDRHADIGRGQPFGPQRQRGIIRVVPRLPEFGALLGVAQRKPVPPCSVAISFTISTCSATPAAVP